jgi:hypothetical protein
MILALFALAATWRIERATNAMLVEFVTRYDRGEQDLIDHGKLPR